MKEKWNKKFDKPHSLLRQYEEIRIQLRDFKNTSQKTELLKKKELLKAEVEIEYEKLIAQAEGSNPYQVEFDIDERYCPESKLNDDIDKKYNLGVLEKRIISLSFYRNNAKDCREMYRGSVLSSLNWIHFDTFFYQKAKMLNYSTLAGINGMSPQDTIKGFPDYELAYIDSTGLTEEETERYISSQGNVVSGFIGTNEFNKPARRFALAGGSNRYKIDGISKKFQDIYGTTNLEDNDTSIQIIRLPDAPHKAVLYDNKGVLINYGKKKTKYETKNLIYRIAKKLKIMEIDHVDTVVTPQKENVSYPSLRKEGLFEFVNKETKFYTPQDFSLTSVFSSSAHLLQADSSLGGEEGKVRGKKGEEFPAYSNIHKKPTYEIVNIPVSKRRAKSEEHRAESREQRAKSGEHRVESKEQRAWSEEHGAKGIEQRTLNEKHRVRSIEQDSRDALSELPNIPNETGEISKYIIPTMTMKEYYLKMLDDRTQDAGDTEPGMQDIKHKIHDARFPIRDPRYPVQGPRYPIQDPRYRIHNPKFGVQDEEQDTRYRMHDTGYKIQDASINEQFALSFSGEGPINKNSMPYALSPMLIERESPFPAIMEKLFSLSPFFEDNKVGNNVPLISNQLSKNITDKAVYPKISPTIISNKIEVPGKNDDRPVRSAEHSESDFVLLSLFNNRDKATSSYAEGGKGQPVVKIDRQNKSIPVQKASPQREEDKDVSLQETGVSAKSTVRDLFTNFCREYMKKKKMHDI